MTLIITHNDLRDRYEFHRVDEDGDKWPLGSFTLNAAGDSFTVSKDLII